MRRILRRSPCSSRRPTPPNSQSASMSTYSLSETGGIGAQASAAQSRDWLRGAGIGILASLGWGAFVLSCRIWEDLGDWSRTHQLGIGAFVVAAVVLVGTLSADRLGRVGAGLRQ